MGLVRCRKYFLFFFCLIAFLIFFLNQQLLAEWRGPYEMVSGSWGDSQEQFFFRAGDVDDRFPKKYQIDGNGNIYISDEVNKRIKVYKSDGDLKIIIKAPSNLKIRSWWPFDIYIHPSGSFVASFKKGQKFFYNAKGEFLRRVNVYGRAIPYEDGYYFLYKKLEYPYYSIDGNLIKVHKEKLPVIGDVNTYKADDRKYKIKVTYPDVVCEMQSNRRRGKHFQDELKNVYRIESFTQKHNDQEFIAYRVFKCDACEKKITLFDMPHSEYEPEPSEAKHAPSWKAIPIIEYGEPIISSAGNLYCWARTKTEYRILKWTWQGEPDTPQSLAVKPSATGILLGWKSPEQNADDVTGYEILRSEQVCGQYKPLDTVEKSVFQYEDKSVKEKATLYYKVRAIKSSGYSGYSNKVAGRAPGGC